MHAPSAAAAFKAQPILMLAAMRFLQDNYATLVDGDGLLLPGWHQSTADPLVEARPSRLERAGTGLFAARDLGEGTIVALYPCDALGVDDHGAASWICWRAVEISNTLKRRASPSIGCT